MKSGDSNGWIADTILDTVPCGFLSFGDDGIVQAANAMLISLLQGEDGSPVGRHLEGFLTVASRIFYQTHLFPLLRVTGRADEIYLALRTGQGEEVPVLINGVRRERDGATVYDCILVPMRRRSQYEDEILRAKRGLEEANLAKEQYRRELEERNAQLEELREGLEVQVERRMAELRTAVADQEGFSYAIAHDLRSPLRAIVAASEILREEVGESLNAEHQALLARQAFNGLKMSSLIDDLLRFARLGRAGVVRETLDLSELAAKEFAALTLPAYPTPPDFRVQSGMTATGDRTLVRMVLRNLIQNAAKYSPDGGEIRIGWTEEKGRRVYFVRDQGIGFDMRHAGKIFRPFERLVDSDRFQGNGIGLATVQRIIDRHGGAVWFESELGKGSTFFFTLE